MAAMKISVLIVSYNVRELLLRCLGSFDASTEVIVVDNASEDGSADAVREAFPWVNLLQNESNLGFSAAVNRAAAEAKGEAFFLLNPDTEVRGESLPRMSELLREDAEVGAVGFRQVDGDNTFQLAIGPPAWLWADLMRGVVQRRLDAGDQRLANFLDGLFARPMTVPWAAASSLLVRREAFEDIQGFDDGFFMYFEDIDFCLRLRHAGWKVFFDPRVTLVHHRGASAEHDMSASQRHYRASQLRFWEKHRGPWARRLVHLYLALRGQAPEPLDTDDGSSL